MCLASLPKVRPETQTGEQLSMASPELKTRNLLERLIDQLDALVPFLALAHKDVFQLIRRDREVWFSTQAQKTLPASYSIYRRQVTHAAFVLGYSYSEAFLSDLLREIYMHNPQMLSKDKALTFDELRRLRSYKAVLKSMVNKEVRSVFGKGLDKVAGDFESKLSLAWPKQEKAEAIRASLIRNCIVHNLGIANIKLAELSDYNVGDTIALEPKDVHSYGLSARSLARDIYKRADSAFLSRKR